MGNNLNHDKALHDIEKLWDAIHADPHKYEEEYQKSIKNLKEEEKKKITKEEKDKHLLELKENHIKDRASHLFDTMDYVKDGKISVKEFHQFENVVEDYHKIKKKIITLEKMKLDYIQHCLIDFKVDDELHQISKNEFCDHVFKYYKEGKFILI
jgi:hypothetical protein